MKLQPVAEKLFKACLTDKLRPTTRDIQIHYKLSEDQADTVKRYTRKIAANLGVIWGWDPLPGYFRVAPDNTPEVVKRMLAYQLGHWKDAGKSTSYMFKGAQVQSYVTKKDSKFVSDLDKEFSLRLKMIEKKVKSL